MLSNNRRFDTDSEDLSPELLYLMNILGLVLPRLGPLAVYIYIYIYIYIYAWHIDCEPFSE